MPSYSILRTTSSGPLLRAAVPSLPSVVCNTFMSTVNFCSLHGDIPQHRFKMTDPMAVSIMTFQDLY